MISSAGNIQIKEIEKLQKKSRYRKETGTFVVEGRKLVEEAGERILKIFLSENYYELHFGEETFLQNREYEVVSDKIFKEMADTATPQGILAKVKMPKYSLDDFLEKEEASYLVLEDVRDPGNLGTMMRTAEGAGITAVILSKDSVDLFNPKVVRATMGSIFRVPFIYVEDFSVALEKMKKAGIVLYGTHLLGKRNYDCEPYAKKAAILIGNEANGITDMTAQAADCLVKIPMEGKLESLNAAVAAALMMYELFRQKRV
ncbi:MAG: RNA methyltransferase [Acetivibrio sp.]